MAEQNLKKFLSFFNLKIKTNKQTKTKEIVPKISMIQRKCVGIVIQK